MNTLIEWEIQTDPHREASPRKLESARARGIESSTEVDNRDDLRPGQVLDIAMSYHEEEPHIGLAMKTLEVVARLGMIHGALLRDLGNKTVLFRNLRRHRQSMKQRRQTLSRSVFIWK
jgi:hypothetical protein